MNRVPYEFDAMLAAAIRAMPRQASGLISYASHTNNRRNLATMREAGWRLLLSPARPKDEWTNKGFRYALDNGAWSAFQRGTDFDEDRFEAMIEAMGGGADWIVLPDIVAGGLKSLELSTRWMNRTLSVCPLVLIAVQDGMEPSDLAPLVGQSVGIFLGGSTEWKLDRMADWGAFCAERGIHYHVARVNTRRRFRMAHAAGAHSVDGSSVSRFAMTMPLLEAARQQPDLLTPGALRPLSDAIVEG